MRRTKDVVVFAPLYNIGLIIWGNRDTVNYNQTLLQPGS